MAVSPYVPVGRLQLGKTDMTESRLSTAVIIATCGRPRETARLLKHLASQTLLPNEVVVSVPDPSHVDPFPPVPFPVKVIFGPKGLTVQRNAALPQVLDRFDIVTFFDDDFVPAQNYLENVEFALRANADWAVVTGDVVKDGATGPGLGWDEGLEALRTVIDKEDSEPRIADHIGAYGCNMSIRCSAIGQTRFDERLVLYGWQEDIDFTSQLRRHGRVVRTSALKGVHLGVKSGKVSGTRFGYSQIVNPIYLIKKGTVPMTFFLPLMFRNICANVVRSIWPESYIDRRGRLRGNLIGIGHVISGRAMPEYILEL